MAFPLGTLNIVLLKIVVFHLVISWHWQTVECARILGVFPLPSRSHYNLGRALMRGLAERGNDVTVISPFGEKQPPKGMKYRDIVLEKLTPLTDTNADKNLFEVANIDAISFQIFMDALGMDSTEKTFQDEDVQELLSKTNTEEHFDVVIVEQFVNDALKYFAHHFRAPLVLFCTFASSSWINPLVGNPAPPSYIAEINQPAFDANKFLHRVRNTLVFIFGELYRTFVFFPKQNRLLHRFFPDAPDLGELMYNASLVLLNSHISTNEPVPRVPIMIDIGGFHVDKSERLPQDLQDFLDESNAPDGVIYFSMGSVLRSAHFPEHIRKSLLKVFGKLKQKVLWKWEEDVLPNKPNNVKLGKWLPQAAILAHPNVKLFITHGGLLSSTETVYHGVPLLAIPVFGDQVENAQMASRNGYGLYVQYAQFNEIEFEAKLREMLSNLRYRENVQKRSSLMHDRPVQPMDLADYWIQHIVRHGGGEHLKVYGIHLPWYQYLSLDVFAFLAAIILFALLVVKFVCYRVCCKSSNKPDQRKKKQ